MNGRGLLPKSLSLRILLMVVSLLVVSFAGIIWYVNLASYRLAYSDQLNNVQDLSRVTALALEETAHGALREAGLLAVVPSVVKALETGEDPGGAVQAMLATIIKGDDAISSIYAFDLAGKPVAGLTGGGADERGKDKSKHAVVREILAGKTGFVDPEVALNAAGRPV